MLHWPANMNSESPKKFQECQRIDVLKQGQGADAHLKISLERFNECLGWYTAGALSIPLHQVPLLQQALDEIKTIDCAECVEKVSSANKIIPFPTMMAEFAPTVEETGS